MLLTDEEIDACLSNPSMHIQARIIYRDFARAIEAAILEKLASAELPEPATITVLKEIPYYTYDQLCEAYAQGAAAQLDRLEKADKDAERYRWLRNGPLVDGEICEEIYVAVNSPAWPCKWALVGSDLDKAVDAMEASK